MFDQSFHRCANIVKYWTDYQYVEYMNTYINSENLSAYKIIDYILTFLITNKSLQFGPSLPTDERIIYSIKHKSDSLLKINNKFLCQKKIYNNEF